MDLGVNATEVSISNTSDPRGGWFNYSFPLPGAWEEVVGVSREDADVLQHLRSRAKTGLHASTNADVRDDADAE